MDFEEEYQQIKEKFSKLKYTLPSFEKLEENFELDKLTDRNQKFILQNIRRIMLEKFGSYSQLFEAVLNSGSSSRIIYKISSKINDEKRKKIKNLVDELIILQFNSIKLETDYNEEKEAMFLNDAFKKWEKIKKEISRLFEEIDISSEEIKDVNESNYLS